jgi:exodeoxyribonuclease I
MTFIFYDTETTGLTAGFDQILQFAAIVTDDDLNAVEEINLRCRLQRHVVPSPGAFFITGVRPSDVAKADLSHYEMIREIRAVIERYTPATIVGYNSISYDEAMLRQAFYQTLNPVYLTNTGGNTRMDILKVAHAASEYAPGVLSIPINEKGRPSFKLELLARANDLLHTDAHEAMSDTLATLGLARMVRDEAPAVWSAMMKTRSKQSTTGILDGADVFCATDMAFKQHSILATRIAVNPDNSSEHAVFDLSLDPVTYVDTQEDKVPGLLKATPRPVRIIKANQSPIVVPDDLANESVPGHDQPPEVLQERIQTLRDNPDFAANIARAMADRYPPFDPPEYVEQRIFESFPSRGDSSLMATFHASPWDERLSIVSRFEDERLRELGERLIYLESSDVLPEDMRRRHDDWRNARIHAGPNLPWVTVGSAVEELTGLSSSDEGNEQTLLEDIEKHLTQLSKSR